MLMLRLQRIGRRNQPHFKVVVIEKTKGPKSRKYIDIVGSYNPKMGTISLDKESIQSWITKGVQISDTVYNMLVDQGIVSGRKKNVLPKKTAIKKEEPESEVAQSEVAAPAEEAEIEKTEGVEEAPAEAPAENEEAPAEETSEEEVKAEPEVAEEAPAE